MNINKILKLTDYFKCGCFEKTFADVEISLSDIFSKGIKGNIDAFADKNDILKLFDMYLTSDNEKRIAIIYEPSNKPNGTVFLSNLSDGWFTLINLLAHRLNVTVYRISLSSLNLKYPKNLFEIIHGPDSKRTIMILKDGRRWQFFEEGERQNFEDSKIYNSKRIKDRLPPETIIDYLWKNEWNLLDDGFWVASRIAVFYE
jgi:hypothetical protein